MSVAKVFSFVVVAIATLIATDASAQQPGNFVRPGGNIGGLNYYPQQGGFQQGGYQQGGFQQGGYQQGGFQQGGYYQGGYQQGGYQQHPGHQHGGYYPGQFPGQRPPVQYPPVIRPPVVQPPVIRPPVVHPPILGQPPMARSYQLNGFANREGNHSGFHRIKLDIDCTGPNTFHINGYVRYANGAEQRVHADAVGEINRGIIHLRMGRIGSIDLRPVGHGFQSELMGEVRLFGALDGNGMVFEIDRD